MSKRMTAAIWVKGMAEMLAAEGMDVRALLAAAGIDPAALEAPGRALADGKDQPRCGSSPPNDRAIRRSGSRSTTSRGPRASTWSATP